ncbi:cytosolic Fe-S cluster assembly factor narfl [Micractinium conductrix]|uniref:Cytosolic Fe-S cluster assembly factor narfl n=1 Tax=Micractinium conductrix TaxID=554055 RepID=A0A2P6VE27_9CHLO|nr:cytosolic Fe-S cluster assembly factor narfl [Micractinium conductrix]|eukprot:PSC72354.1 cytosolic Fe-S cluster assembly factor narfl [Micractinium conductrix]
MAAFSGAVKIGDLNDFIAPSQACVVSLEGGKLGAAAAEPELGTVQLQQRPRGGGFSQTRPATADQAVKVSLHDCLACSGCVTSAETVLLQHQSTGELLQRLADPQRWAVVVSLSPQSVSALAALHGLPAGECAARLAAFLRGLGARAVLDLGAARHLALAEAAAEFVARFRASPRGAATLAAAGAAAGPAAAAAAAAAGGDAMDVDGAPPAASSSGDEAGPVPMLASACPGWVCYAEKTHGEHVLPYIATGKSPQAMQGTLVKQRWCAAAGLPPDGVYHCAVMPCYDKKLEASRGDFDLHGTQVAETDCVLATTELQELLEQKGVDLRSVAPEPLDSLLAVVPGSSGSGSGWPAGASSSGGDAAAQPGAAAAAAGSAGSGPGSTAPAPPGSGGYLEHVFRAAAWQLFGQRLPPEPLQTVVGRNTDLREVSLEVAGTTVLRFAAAYGFRNIQGLMRKIKLRRCEFDYVEIMACPSGCLNGGGQPKPRAGQSAAERLEQLELLYAAADGATTGGGGAAAQAQAAVEELYGGWVGGPPGSAAARQLLHTQYHHREKTVTATLSDW